MHRLVKYEIIYNLLERELIIYQIFLAAQSSIVSECFVKENGENGCRFVSTVFYGRHGNTQIFAKWNENVCDILQQPAALDMAIIFISKENY